MYRLAQLNPNIILTICGHFCKIYVVRILILWWVNDIMNEKNSKYMESSAFVIGIQNKILLLFYCFLVINSKGIFGKILMAFRLLTNINHINNRLLKKIEGGTRTFKRIPIKKQMILANNMQSIKPLMKSISFDETTNCPTFRTRMMHIWLL